MSEENRSNETLVGPNQNLYYLLLGVAALLLATAIVVIDNNSIRTTPIYIFLFFLGLGGMLGLGLGRGSFVALLVISIWIITKQRVGIWTADRLFFSSIELTLMGSTFVVSGIYHDQLKQIVTKFTEDQVKLKLLDFEDKSIGLIKTPIGLLRLSEEQDRSVRFRRPFSLILMAVKPLPGAEWGPKESTSILRAIAANVKDVTRSVDFPFLAAADQIAILLPETNQPGTNRVITHISERMVTTRFVPPTGKSVPIQDRAQIWFGYTTYTGQGSISGDMMKSAQESLQKSQQTNFGELFANPLIDYVVVGECIEATPDLKNKVR